MMHPASLDVKTLLSMCSVRRQRRSGPGGQHRNKVETAIVITHDPSGIVAEGTERRSQAQNQQVAVQRLRVNLALKIRSSDQLPVSETWRSRVTGGKIRVNPDHADFPAILAEALDAIHFAEGDLPKAATTLHVSNSQLIKLLQVDPRALQQINQERAANGLRPLK